MTEKSRESRWWHCVGCGNAIFVHTQPTGMCGQCAGRDWRTGKASSGLGPCTECKVRGNRSTATHVFGEVALCADHYEMVINGIEARHADGVRVVNNELACPRCGGHDFSMIEGGYWRIDGVRLDMKHRKIIGKFFEFSDDGGGEIYLMCDNPKCESATRKYAIPDGFEVDYE